MSRQDIAYLLDRYLQGNISAQEKELVEQWLSEHNNADSEWQHLSAMAREKWLNDVFAEIQGTITPVKKIVPLYQNTLWKTVAAIAAVITIFFTLFISWPAIHGWLTPDNMIAMQVPLNQKQQITLADGSTVFVNAGSELKYPKVFNGKTREVYLSGEAYFDIIHDKSKPFIVHTGKVVTTVLGTAFDINAGRESGRIVVTVTRGKVSVADGKGVIGYITPDQQITYDTKSSTHIQKTVNAAQVVSWQQNDLHFEDITFEDAAKILQQQFKVQISFANDKIKNCRFSGTALKGKNINQILKVICAFNNAAFHYRADHTIVIDGKGCD